MPDALALLRRRMEAAPAAGYNLSGLVFPDPRTGAVWRPSSVAAQVKTAANHLNASAGLPYQRQGGITALLEAGVPLSVVSKQAGHASTEMTEAQYGWVTDELAQQQIAAVETGFAKSGKTTQVVSSQKTAITRCD